MEKTKSKVAQLELNKKEFKQAIQQRGIASFCCTDPKVMERVLLNAKERGEYALIEATSNQVNQTGGYVGLTPAQFVERALRIAEKTSFDLKYLVLGGDHIGPLPWKELPAKDAMEKAEKLMESCIKAGYAKIHIDTSMSLGGDPNPLPEKVKVARSVQLYRTALKAYEERRKSNSGLSKPLFVIGSDVPFPGGQMVADKGTIEITPPENLWHTLDLYQKEFAKAGYEKAFADIIGMVVELGLEFDEYEGYRSEPVIALKSAMDQFPELVLEAHSTDFQKAETLTSMKHDGVGILKVGPELSYAHREALLALSAIEAELIPEDVRGDYPAVLEAAMVEDPIYWESWYDGDEKELHCQRMHSKLDRGRYYMTVPAVQMAEHKLIQNLKSISVPAELIRKYFPETWEEVQHHGTGNLPEDLIQAEINRVVQKYMEA